MLRCSRLLSLLFLAGFAAPCYAALIQTFDLKTLCFLSTNVVEACLTRHHVPGQPEWTDRFTATVLNPLEGRFHAGDQIKGLDLSLYDPTRTEQHCILFLAPNTVFLPTPPKNAPVRTVDMMLIDNHNRVRRYFQQSDPGGLAAEGFTRIPLPPTSTRTIIHRHNAAASMYQENSAFTENDAAEQKYPTLAEEHLLTTSGWAAMKKLKAPPYQVLHR